MVQKHDVNYEYRVSANCQSQSVIISRIIFISHSGNLYTIQQKCKIREMKTINPNVYTKLKTHGNY